MTVRLSQWTLDVQGVEMMSAFWAAALGYRSGLGDDGSAKLYPPDGSAGNPPTVWLQASASDKSGKNRCHPDLTVLGGEDVDREVERLIRLGARRVDVGQTGNEPFVVLTDPEDNEFCILRVAPDDSVRQIAAGRSLPEGTDCVLLDVDGTLVDSNYQHVLAWEKAFAGFGLVIPNWRIHRHIGMGGDQIVPALAGDDVERAHGDQLRDSWGKVFETLLDDVVPFDGACDLVLALRERGLKVVLASSGAAGHVEHYLDLLELRDDVDAWTTSDDVETTKPEPDLLAVARDRVGGRHPVTVGDSTWDCEAANRLGAVSYGVRTGGFSADELLVAGARQVFDSLPDLTKALV